MTGREITGFSTNDDKPLDLSNPPTGGTAVTRPETGAPVDRYAFYLRGEMPPGWAPNIWENYCRMVAPLEGLHRSREQKGEPPMPNAPAYTDFDGAQARVSNGVLCITWTAPNTGAANMTITPLSLIMWVGWTDEGDSCTVFYFGGHSLVVSCEKSRELTEFIRKHLEEANG